MDKIQYLCYECLYYGCTVFGQSICNYDGKETPTGEYCHACYKFKVKTLSKKKSYEIQ